VKSTLAISFLLVYGLTLIRPVIPLVDYYIKLERYKRDCINKNRPELLCNGQCILIQRLKAANVQGREPSAPAPIKINLQDNPINIFEESTYDLSLSLSSDTENPLPDPTLITTYVVEIFHPPSSRG